MRARSANPIRAPKIESIHKRNDDSAFGVHRCCLPIEIHITEFGALLFPQTSVDNTTIMGAAELGGAATTKSITTLLFPDTYLYFNGNPNNCCVLGFHQFDYEPGTAENGYLPRFYVMNYASWISRGLFGPGFEDVTALRHEMAEPCADPFVVFDQIHNLTPWWFSSDPTGRLLFSARTPWRWEMSSRYCRRM